MLLLLMKWVWPLLLSLLHPFYVSVTEINYNGKEKTLEISCKVFADDMEQVLKKNYKTAVNLVEEKQLQQNNRFINDYIARRLAITADGKALHLTYLGFEKENESVYCYFEIPDVVSPKKLDLVNSLLQDLNEQQINIIHVTIAGNRKSYKLDFPNKQTSFVF
jgi:uncharacterized protein YlxP (DUF503 family)